MPKAVPNTSLALRNLRGVLILLIVAFHCFSAYIVSQPATAPPFDSPPFDWRAFPIIDHERWLGFDLFCASQFLYLMQLMFFLSGLFVWSSIERRGAGYYLRHRLVRLGVPFVLGTYLLMPLAFYPVYRVTAVNPGWSSFWAHWQALPITPTGPMWFLWFLVVLNVGAVLLYQVWPAATRLWPWLARLTMPAPSRAFLITVAVTAVAYLPLAAIYSPWTWVGLGPFEVQAAFAPQYMIYFFLGVIVGACGYERGLLDMQGILARRWLLWLIGGIAAFFLWLIPTALLVKMPEGPVVVLRVIGDLGLVTFAAAISFALVALFLRFAAVHWPVIDGISENGYGIYFFHYLFTLWLQYALLSFALPAVAKGVIVLIGTVAFSWAASLLTNTIVANGWLLLARGAVLLGADLTANGRVSQGKFPD